MFMSLSHIWVARRIITIMTYNVHSFGWQKKKKKFVIYWCEFFITARFFFFWHILWNFWHMKWLCVVNYWACNLWEIRDWSRCKNGFFKSQKSRFNTRSTRSWTLCLIMVESNWAINHFSTHTRANAYGGLVKYFRLGMFFNNFCEKWLGDE